MLPSSTIAQRATTQCYWGLARISPSPRGGSIWSMRRTCHGWLLGSFSWRTSCTLAVTWGVRKNGEETVETWVSSAKSGWKWCVSPPKWGAILWRQVGSFLPWKEVEKTRQNFGSVNEFISKHCIYSIYTGNIWRQRLRWTSKNGWTSLAALAGVSFIETPIDMIIIPYMTWYVALSENWGMPPNYNSNKEHRDLGDSILREHRFYLQAGLHIHQISPNHIKSMIFSRMEFDRTITSIFSRGFIEKNPQII